ncbi:MAG: hypothetical protein R3F60_13205 [bacterium]
MADAGVVFAEVVGQARLGVRGLQVLPPQKAALAGPGVQQLDGPLGMLVSSGRPMVVPLMHRMLPVGQASMLAHVRAMIGLESSPPSRRQFSAISMESSHVGMMAFWGSRAMAA